MLAQTTQRVFTISEAAALAGVSTKTLRRWEKKFEFSGRRTRGNQRRYTKSQLVQLLKLTSVSAQPLATLKGPLKTLKKEIKTTEKIVAAATEDLAAETLRVSSYNPNSLVSTGFLLLLDLISIFIRQIHLQSQVKLLEILKSLNYPKGAVQLLKLISQTLSFLIITFTLFEIGIRLLGLFGFSFTKLLLRQIQKIEQQLVYELTILENLLDNFSAKTLAFDEYLTHHSKKHLATPNVKKAFIIISLFLIGSVFLSRQLDTSQVSEVLGATASNTP